MDWWYPTAFQSWGHEETDAMRRVEMSGRYTMGPEVAAFEAEFAAFHGMKHAIMVNSGSSANLLMIAALKERSRNADLLHAIVPALAWSTTYAPLRQHNIGLLLADVGDTWNVDWPAVAALMDERRPQIIIGCSILGNPANLQTMANLAEAHGATFLEDNCESLGAGFLSGTASIERRTGTFGLMNSFSLFWSHQLSAIEGGVITTNDDDLNRTLRMLRAHGWTRDVDTPSTFDGEYRFELMGYNVRPLELHAAIARAQLPKLETFRRFREGNLNNFIMWTSGLPIAHQKRNGIPSPFGLAFRVKDSATRQMLVRELRKNGIDCRLPTGGSFTRHPYGAPWREQKTPAADEIHDTGLFLGNAPFDIGDKILRAVEIMREVL